MVLAHLALTSRYVHWFALVFSFQTQNYVSRRLKIEKLQASLHLVIIEALLGSRSLENFKTTTYCNQSVGSAVLLHSFQCPHQTVCLCCPRNDFYAWHCLTLLDNMTTSSSLAPQDSLPMLNTGVISCLRTGFLLISWSMLKRRDSWKRLRNGPRCGRTIFSAVGIPEDRRALCYPMSPKPASAPVENLPYFVFMRDRSMNIFHASQGSYCMPINHPKSENMSMEYVGTPETRSNSLGRGQRMVSALAVKSVADFSIGSCSMYFFIFLHCRALKRKRSCLPEALDTPRVYPDFEVAKAQSSERSWTGAELTRYSLSSAVLKTTTDIVNIIDQNDIK